MKNFEQLFFASAIFIATIASCSGDRNETSDDLILSRSEIYSKDMPAQLFIEHSQILQIAEYYYFVDELGYYHFFDEGRPTCPDSTRQAIKAQIIDIEEANNMLYQGDEIFWFNKGTVLYGKSNSTRNDAPHCPSGTYQGDSPKTFSTPVSCNAGTKKKPKVGTKMCKVETRLCIEYLTGSTDKSTTGTPYDCGRCKKSTKKAEDFGEEVIITPYCWY